MRNLTALLILLATGAAGVAHAGEATLTWEKPTTNCDGTPIKEPVSYEIRWGQKRATAAAGASVFTAIDLAPGDWWFNVAAVDADGVLSDFVTAAKTIPAAEFKTRTTTVYTLVKRDDRVVMLPVGTVAFGVQCDASHNVNGKFVVPRAAVTWSGSVKDRVVFGDCG
jgi:hypothetical protein